MVKHTQTIRNIKIWSTIGLFEQALEKESVIFPRFSTGFTHHKWNASTLLSTNNLSFELSDKLLNNSQVFLGKLGNFKKTSETKN